MLQLLESPMIFFPNGVNSPKYLWTLFGLIALLYKWLFVVELLSISCSRTEFSSQIHWSITTNKLGWGLSTGAEFDPANSADCALLKSSDRHCPEQGWFLNHKPSFGALGRIKHFRVEGTSGECAWLYGLLLSCPLRSREMDMMILVGLYQHETFSYIPWF